MGAQRGSFVPYARRLGLLQKKPTACPQCTSLWQLTTLGFKKKCGPLQDTMQLSIVLDWSRRLFSLKAPNAWAYMLLTKLWNYYTFINTLCNGSDCYSSPKEQECHCSESAISEERSRPLHPVIAEWSNQAEAKKGWQADGLISIVVFDFHQSLQSCNYSAFKE